MFIHMRATINQNAGYDDETAEEEMTTFLGLQFENIPWMHTYRKICYLSWTCFKCIINIYESEFDLFDRASLI